MRPQAVVTVVGGAALGLVLLLAHSSLPTAVGGETTYLQITGRSMLPRLVAGDVVGVRPSPPYATGDVVAYRNPDLGLVVHRIIAWDGDRAVLRGDNNSSEDEYHAEVSEMIGTPAVRLPGAARYLPASPLVLPAVLGGLAFAAVLLHWSRRRRREATSTTRSAAPVLGRTALIALCSAGMLSVVVAVVLQVAGRVLPATTVEQDDVSLRHLGTLAYSGGAIVDPAQSGFPVFRADGGTVALRFDYQATGVPVTDAAGTVAIEAQVQLTNGWRETIPIVSATPFVGTATLVTGSFELRPVWEALEHLSARTGIEWGTARVLIVPEVRMTGQSAGGALKDTVGKPFTFVLDKRQMRLDEPWRADRLQFTATTRIPMTRTVTQTIPVLGWTPDRLVTLSYVIAVPAVLMLALAVAWDASQRRHRGRAGEHADLGHAIGHAITPGALASIGERRTVVELRSLHDLAAARGEEPLFLDESEGASTYFVLRNETAFLYRDAGTGDAGTGDAGAGEAGAGETGAPAAAEPSPEAIVEARDEAIDGEPERPPTVISIDRNRSRIDDATDVPLWLFPPRADVRRSA